MITPLWERLRLSQSEKAVGRSDATIGGRFLENIKSGRRPSLCVVKESRFIQLRDVTAQVGAVTPCGSEKFLASAH